MILLIFILFFVLIILLLGIGFGVFSSRLIEEDKKRKLLLEETESVIRYKGLLIREFPKDYTIIDIETTGLDPRIDKIIEISAIKYRDDIEVDSFSSLVNIHSKIPHFIESLTGIKTNMIKNSPEIEYVIKQFYDFIADDILIGYNVGFDINFLYDALYSATSGEILLKNNFIDVMYIAKRVLKDLENYKQRTVALYYNINIDNMHRAFGDCKLCNSIYEYLKKDILEKWGSFDKFYVKRKNN